MVVLLLLSTHSRGISPSTDAYCSSLKEIHDIDKNRTLNDQEIRQLRCLSGQLNWIVTHSRPDVAYDNCIVGNSINKATTQTIIQANKAVRKARTHEVSLNYPSHFNISSSKIMGYTESFGNLPNGGSQGVFKNFLCDQKGQATLIMWHSRRITQNHTK